MTMADTAPVQAIIDAAKPDALLPPAATFNVTSYAELVAALAAANNGDTINLAAGIYVGNITVTHDVTINGANAGVRGQNARGAESNIIGGIDVSASGVTIDGVAVSGAITGAGAPFNSGIYLTGNNFTLVNSWLAGNGFDAAVLAGSTVGLNISDNRITGYSIGAYISGGGSTGTIHDNLFQGDGVSGSGLGNGVNSETAGVLIQNNVFDSLYAGVINLFPFGVASVDLNSYVIGNTLINNAAVRPIQIYPTQGGQSFIGTNANETFNGDSGGSNYIFNGGGGDVLWFGGHRHVQWWR
jgi:hypothetical protein